MKSTTGTYDRESNALSEIFFPLWSLYCTSAMVVKKDVNVAVQPEKNVNLTNLSHY